MRLLVTGGLGFLGSHFIRHVLKKPIESVLNFDAETYAGDPRRLDEVEDEPRYRFFKGDVRGPELVQLLRTERVDAIIHFAAETHVTRGETDPVRFHQVNFEGTQNLLAAAAATGIARFIHVSTDEVYGSILSGAFAEEDKERGDSQATSAYAKSKSRADDLSMDYSSSVNVLVARPTNAFGPWQFPEKAFARWVTRALRGEQLPMWGDGLYVRQWLHGEDIASAIWTLLEKGKAGEAYNIAPKHDPEITNLDLAKWLVGYLNLPEERIVFTAYDRPDHDKRYAVNARKMRELGWTPGEMWSQLAETVEWYRNNLEWWLKHIDEAESIYHDLRT